MWWWPRPVRVRRQGLNTDSGLSERGYRREVRGARGGAAGLPLKAYKSFPEKVER